jgi:NTE family protein
LAEIETVGRTVFADAPLLRGASARALEDLVHAGREVRVDARAWLFRAGEAADRLFVVLAGRMQVVAPEDGRVLREVGPGAALGELGVLTGTARSAGVRAVRDSRLLELDAASFVRLVESDGGFALSVARELARQLQESGGLELPQTRPAVFTVVGAGSGDAHGFAHELGDALARWGSVATLAGDGVEPDGFAAELEDAERRFGHVLLLDGPEPWRSFCRRQCDRLLVVARGEPPTAAEPAFEGCEVVLVGVEPGDVGRWLDTLRPRAHHVVGAGDPDGVGRVARRLTHRSLGVVLSGGGARGFAHIGVLAALAEAGAGPEDVVRTRMYLTRREDADEVIRVHGELFGDVRPAATAVVVQSLIDPRYRIEIEADAVRPG